MKKSFMSNIKNFVDSNVRQRIDRVAHNYGEPLSDDILSVERHFEDIRQVCVDADKKISALLQSIQLASNQSHLGAYTQNVQAGLNNLSHNIGLQAASITSPSINSHPSSAQSISSNSKLIQSQTSLKVSPQLAISGDSKSSTASNTALQYRSNESLSNGSNTLTNSHDSITSHPNDGGINCQPTEKLSEDVQQRYKKLPVVGFYKFLVKSSRKLRQDSLLAITISQCSQLQIQLTNLYLTYEKLIETQCLKPIQLMIETDIPNVIKLRKLFIKSHNDYEFLKSKYNGATLKQLQLQQSQQTAQPGHFANSSYFIAQSGTQPSNTNKLDQLKNELDEAVTRFEQARDTYEAELYGFVCRETELVNLLRMFYRYQAEYHQQVATIMQALLPGLEDALASTPRKAAFGTTLIEHRRCTGRELSPVIELCTHFLNLQGLREEGLFRIPGSSVKIKKLRNGINAWFLSLASLEELEIDQKQSGHHCVTALYDLFKSAVGQRIHQSQNLQQAPSVSSVVVKSTLAVDETVLNQTNFSGDNLDSNDLILDVHSIAGLLKLYLRELPEPLCTFKLYDDWIRCVDNNSDGESRLKLFAAVIEKLPLTHRANLSHIIKFLQQLTLHKDRNKMTSTNLAIAMAPSLMWSKPIESDQQSENNSDVADSVNMQMSTFGISASHHALILEALINNADSLFPGPADFSLPGFDNLKLDSGSRNRCSTRSRSVKSTSPTGMSTASSSSYSSNTSNNVTTSSGTKGHSRKGGSMEGLIANQDAPSIFQHQNPSIRSVGRPVSVQIQRDEYSNSLNVNNPPPKPPVPTIRSQSRQPSTDDRTALAPSRSHSKPQAPPVPPPTSVRHQLERLKTSNSVSSSSNGPNNPKPRPISLRGTGVIESTGSNHHATRPNVPPPKRPQSASKDHEVADKDLTKQNLKQLDDVVVTSNGSRGSDNDTALVEANGKQSSASSALNSLDSVSEGDSSFDNESDRLSLEQASTDGAAISKQAPASGGDVEGSKGDTIGRSQSREQSECDDENKQAPVKPPRSNSPKAALSTPL